MPIFELYENPHKHEGELDVYRYNSLPRPLKVTVFSLIQQNAVPRDNSARRRAYENYREKVGALANTADSPPERLLQPYVEEFRRRMDVNEFTVLALCNEYGVLKLPELPFYQNKVANSLNVAVGGLPSNDESPRKFHKELKNFCLQEKEAEHDLNAIQLAFDFIRKYVFSSLAAQAVEELNSRFRQHRIGYELGDNGFTRIDSQFMHEKTVKPVLNLLTGTDYSNAQEEFLKACKNYQAGDYKTALTECSNSLESVLKIICTKQGWDCDRKNASALIQKAIDAGLVPRPWKKHISALPDFLAAVSTARNQFSAHGQGAEEAAPIAPHMIAYALHMTAASILFLAEAEKVTQTS